MMKTKNLIILASFVAIAMVAIYGCRPNKKTNDSLFSKLDSAYILTRNNAWIKTIDSGNVQRMLCERRMGFGPAVKIKIFRSGTLREVYRKYYTKYDTVTYDPIDSIMNLEIRSRQVQPGEYWVIAATDIYLDNQLIRVENDGDQYYGSPTPEEIKDPAWTPKSYQATFTNLTRLGDYAKRNNCWLVICSKQTMDLLGWGYEPTECFLLKIAGKSLPVLKLKSWGKEKIEWEPIHIQYRYLCISLGGRDIEYGPGVSAFNINDGDDPGSIEDDDFVKIDCNNGTGYYYGEEIKNFSLNNFEGI